MSASLSMTREKICGPSAIRASNSLPTERLCGSELIANPPLNQVSYQALNAASQAAQSSAGTPLRCSRRVFF